MKLSKADKAMVRGDEILSEKLDPRRRHFNTGSNNGQSKLNELQVMEIRMNEGKLRQVDLAKKYDVSAECIKMVQLRRTWKHVE